jgi:hypothetical protein
MNCDLPAPLQILQTPQPELVAQRWRWRQVSPAGFSFAVANGHMATFSFAYYTSLCRVNLSHSYHFLLVLAYFCLFLHSTARQNSDNISPDGSNFYHDSIQQKPPNKKAN